MRVDTSLRGSPHDRRISERTAPHTHPSLRFSAGYHAIGDTGLTGPSPVFVCALHGRSPQAPVDKHAWNADIRRSRIRNEAHGDCVVPHTAVDPLFGPGVSFRRTVAGLRDNPDMHDCPERRAWLSQIGFDWRTGADAIRERGLHNKQRALVRDAVAFVKLHARAPKSTKGAEATGDRRLYNCLAAARNRTGFTSLGVSKLDAAWREVTSGSRFPRRLLCRLGGRLC